MARIFISYKRVDKDKVFKIKDRIESALDEKCWIDFDGIESDAQFMNVIIKAIRECEVLLFMYSKTHSQITDFEKDWTVRELNFASKKDKRIVFVNIDGSVLSDEFEFMYGTKQHVDATSSFAINKLICDLGKWLRIDNKQTSILLNSKSVDSVTYEKKVKEVISRISGVDEEKICGWQRLTELHVNTGTLAVQLQNKYHIVLPHNYLRSFDTVNDVISFVEKLENQAVNNNRLFKEINDYILSIIAKDANELENQIHDSDTLKSLRINVGSLAARLENLYKIKVPYEKLRSVITVKDFILLVCSSM